MLEVDKTVLVLVDVQEKLSRAMHERDALIENTVRMVKGAVVLGLPIVCSEQNPRGLGQTVPEVAGLLPGLNAVTKLSFSCWGEPAFVEELKKHKRPQVVLGGIECHVCVYQTVRDLVKEGYRVEVLADAVSSRTLANKEIGLAKCKEVGASITSVEAALFEMLVIAEGDKFKQMLGVVK